MYAQMILKNIQNPSVVLSQIKGEYWFTLASWSVLVLGHFLIIAIGARLFTPENLALFLVGRRVLPLLEPIATIGMAVALPKFVAQTEDTKIQQAYWASSLFSVFVWSTLIAVTMSSFKTDFSKLFFGSTTHTNSIYSMSIMLIGVSVGTCCYGLFRGRQQFYTAGILNLLRIFIIPTSALLIGYESIELTWTLTGIFLVGMTCICIFKLTPPLYPLQPTMFRSAFRTLTTFGFQRGLANVIGVGMLSVPVIITTMRSGLLQSGLIAFGMTVVSGTTYLYGALDIVLLPYASKMIAQRNYSDLLRKTKPLLALVLATSVVLVVTLEYLSPYIVRYILNRSDSESIWILKVMLSAIIPYSVYMAFRGVIDAKYQSVKVTINMLVALLMLAVTWITLELLGHPSLLATLYGFVVGMYTLGAITVFDLLRNNQIEPIEVQ